MPQGVVRLYLTPEEQKVPSCHLLNSLTANAESTSQLGISFFQATRPATGTSLTEIPGLAVDVGFRGLFTEWLLPAAGRVVPRRC